jgi:outer membrane protein assembly factor BamD (BamD/ComL family)
MKQRILPLLIIAGAIAVFTACQTAPPEIPDDLEPAEYFQRAQEAVDGNRYETALAYYRAVIDRFPDDPATQVAAEYEIAFINYKMGNPERATKLFEELLARYEEADSQQLPQWPRVLASKVLERIESGERSGAGAAEAQDTGAS